MQVQPISDINTNSQYQLGNKLKPIGTNSQSNRQSAIAKVDQLLTECQELIEPEYKKWFAGKFYDMNADTVRRAASEARNDGKNPKRLFSFLIKKLA